MSNRLPIKYKDGLFNKIKKFFGNIFKKSNVETIEVTKENKVKINAKEDEFEKMKMASNRVKIKEEILDIIEKRPELIETLSIDKLKELDSIYDEIILENDRKIKKLKRKIA